MHHPVPNGSAALLLWDESNTYDGAAQSFYAMSFDGNEVVHVRKTTGVLRLAYAEFDPTVSIPVVAEALAADPNNALFIVQLRSTQLPEIAEDLSSFGATIYDVLPDEAYIVKMDSTTYAKVGSLPYVRWIGPFPPAYRVDAYLRELLLTGITQQDPIRYSISVFKDGGAFNETVVARLKETGATILVNSALVGRLEAFMRADQLAEIARVDEVASIDIPGDVGFDVNNVRVVSGAQYIESSGGFTGLGVRGEVIDDGVCYTTGDCCNPVCDGSQSHPYCTIHGDFTPPPQLVGSYFGDGCTHGTRVYGLLFGKGTGNADAKGTLPDGTGFWAPTIQFDPYGSNPATGDRAGHTAQLVDPNGAYRCVFQSNSWGHNVTTAYTSFSQQMDSIIFNDDLLICQSHSNDGYNLARPESWAKNIVSVGGLYYYGNADSGDDTYCEGDGGCGLHSTCASTGPAADGRIKPDLVHFSDCRVPTTADYASPANPFLTIPILAAQAPRHPLRAACLGFFSRCGTSAFSVYATERHAFNPVASPARTYLATVPILLLQKPS